jgi:lysophospholipase L1-like esterase
MAEAGKPTRRRFLEQASGLTAAAIAMPPALSGLPALNANPPQGGENYRFLFQGDSITDGNRSRDMDWNHVLGHGYAYLLAAQLWYEYPTKGFQFFNRGVSGNQVTDLAARWQNDALALKPDLISILIGVNDTLNAVNGNREATVQSFEKNYRDLLKQTRQQLPAVELVICEPFILPVGRVKEKWNDFNREVSCRQDVAKKMAEEFGAIYLPLQQRFNEAAEKYPPFSYWLWDGVHPMPNGHEMIALDWRRVVGKKIKFIV